MDVNNIKVGNDGDGRRSKLLHTSEIVVSSPQLHNGHSSTINLSYQIVLQDHNYGAPLPPPSSETTISADQCKQETIEVVSPSATYVPVTNQQQRVNLKTLQPQRQGPASTSPQPTKGGTAKTNGTSNLSVNKRQRTTSGTLQVNNCSNGVSLSTNHINNSPASSNPAHRKSYDSSKSSAGLNTSAPPLLVPKSGLTTFPYSAVQGVGGDLNSHLYAAAANDKLLVKEEDKANGGSVGLSNYTNSPKGWFRNKEQTRSRSDLRDSFNDDSNESLSSPHMATESDQEGEETETAPECEGEEDEEQHEESITRCICKFGHDDGYMICCDRCSVWQHVECMNLDRNNIPEEYLCELCQPRRVDRARARAVQYRKRQEFRLSTPPPSGREGPVKRLETPSRSKDRYSKEPKEEYIDVERTHTPKKVCRNSGSAQGPKYGRSSGINSTPGSSVSAVSSGKNLLRGEVQKAGKRGGPKWKRKLDKQDDVDNKERLPRKRKIMRSKLASDTIDVGGTTVAENSPTARGNGSAELLLQWIDHYEEAVTNHYSPELRARVSAVRPNGLFCESLSPPSNPPAYRLASKAGGFKTLVASCPIASGTPVIECRGKYMLSSQLRPYKTGSDMTGSNGGNGLRPTPHILFHHLPTTSSDGCSPTPVVEMCVDGRSYGNEARFVWQSCQPNAEVKHKVEKGSLHLYLVAKLEILDSEEITIAHDSKNPLPCPYEGCPHMAGNKDNGRTGLTSTASHNPTAHDLERKRRRRRTNSTAAVEAPTTPVSPVATGVGAPQTPAHNTPSAAQSAPLPNTEPSAATAPSTPPTVSAPPPTPVKRQYRTPSKSNPAIDEDSADGGSHHYDEVDGTGDHESSSNGKKKLSREERKMEAIMKAFERMEKAEQRKQALARTSHRKDGKDVKDDECMDADVERSSSPPPLATSSLLNTSLALPADRKDLSSYDSKTRNFRRGIPMRKRGGGTRLRRTSSGAGIGGASGNASGSRSRTRALSGEIHSGHSATEGEESEHGGSSSSPGQGSHTGTSMDDSQVMAFKCPKTKKVVFNNWSAEGDLNGAKDLNDPACGSSLALSVPMCYMRNPNPRSPTRSIRTAHLRPSTLASLKSPSGSGSPDPHGEGGQSNDENLWAAPLPGSAGGSAKKRWLRQAISEETETESPNSGQGGGGGVGVGAPINSATEVLDHVTPLKKRRLARASLSSETSFTPPSTPTPTLERGPLGSNENTTSESIMTMQPSTSHLSGTGTGGLDKDESPNLDSLSADNSQTTPPQCEDVDVVEHKLAATIARTNVSMSIPTIPLPKDSSEKDQIVKSPLNGFVNESSQSLPLLRPAADNVDGNAIVHAQVDGAPAFLPAEAASLLSLRYSISDDSSYTSAVRPTWEFRAPDAQFMRNRNPNETSQTGEASPSDAAQLSPAEDRPKPVKKKLSILEYRQRKQNLNSESGDTSKEELTTANSSDSSKTVTSKDAEDPALKASAALLETAGLETKGNWSGNANSVTTEEFSSSLDGSSTASSDVDVETSSTL